MVILVPPINPQPINVQGIIETVMTILGYATVAFVAYKGLQFVFDEDFGDGEFPRWFRDELRDDHVALHGSRCPRCEERVRYEELTVDHIVAMKNGGLTSRVNAEIMCRSCNSRKGARNTFFDYARGRAA